MASDATDRFDWKVAIKNLTQIINLFTKTQIRLSMLNLVISYQVFGKTV